MLGLSGSFVDFGAIGKPPKYIETGRYMNNDLHDSYNLFTLIHRVFSDMFIKLLFLGEHFISIYRNFALI